MRPRGALWLTLLGASCHLVLPHAPPDGRPPERGLDRAAALERPLPDRGRPDLPPSCQKGTSCRDLAERCAGLASGSYEVDPDGPAGPLPPFVVHCEMALDGGGWTLVARSAGSAFSDSFGWRVDAGSLAVDEQPYSLDLLSRGYPFTQALIGARGAGKEWGANVYRLDLPSDFATAYGGVGVALTAIHAAKGTCVPDLGNQSMLRYLGCTSDRGWFFLRDHAVCENFGLMAHGFSIAAGVSGVTPCDRWGQLQNKHGMIFVR